MNVDKIHGWTFARTPAEHRQTLPIGLATDNEEKKLWRQYRALVWKLTEEVAAQIPGIELRSFKGHHIDHKTSIWFCWKNGIPAEHAARLSNLRMLPYKENMLKGTKCH